MKIVTIVGARPQFIKCAPVSKQIRKKNEEILVHTGQHYDENMSAVFFEEMGIFKPDYELSVGSGLHGEQTGKMLSKIECVLLKEEPDLVLVYGDTNSTLAGALAAAKLNIKIAHIESGLRSFDKMMPEEINRKLTDHISDFLFCPTNTAIENLKNEGITDNVYDTGDVMIDAIVYYRSLAEDKSTILDELKVESKKYSLATIHRPSNTNSEKNLQSIVEAFIFLDENIIFPMHPRTLHYLKKYDLYDILNKNVIVTEPLGYLDMIKLMNGANKIITDSGGIQKEAYALGIPCITLRKNTEWTETIDAGWNVLVGSNKESIIKEATSFEPPISRPNLYGDGNSSLKICEILDLASQ